MSKERTILLSVIEHLYSMSRPAMSGGQCRYLTEEEETCAVGFLLKREFYRKEFEGNSFSSFRTELEYSTNLRFTAEFEKALLSLQHIHDYMENWNESGLEIHPTSYTRLMAGLSSFFLPDEIAQFLFRSTYKNVRT